MSDFKILKCPACGSSMVETESETLVKCSHCGSQLIAKHSGLTHKKLNKGLITKLLYLVIFLILAMITGFLWFSVNKETNTIKDFQTKDSNEIQQTHPNQLINKTISSIPTLKKSNNEITNESIKNNDNTTDKPLVTIMKKVEGETSIGGKYWIVTIRNDSSKEVVRPRVILSMFDQNKRRIGEQVGWAKQDTLSVGEETAVLVLVSKPPVIEYTSNMEALATYPKYITSSLENITVDDFIVNNDTRNKYILIGDVSNQNDFRVDFIWVQAIAKDNNGNVIGLADAFVTHSSLSNQEISGFKISAGTFITQKPASWTLIAKGRKHRDSK